MKRMQGYGYVIIYQVWIMLVLRHRQSAEAKLNEQGITRYDLGREKF